MKHLVLMLAALVLIALVACDSGNSGYQPPPLPTLEGGADGAVDASADAAPDMQPTPEAGADVVRGPCMTVFHYTPPAGTSPHTVAVTGEWNSFAQPGVPMAGPDANGAYTGSVQLAPGLVAYKLLVDGAFTMDPAARWQKYVNGVANSGVQVTDCHLPTLTFASKSITRAAQGQGDIKTTVTFTPGQGAPGIDPSTAKATLRKDGVGTPLPSVSVDATGASISVDAPSLADGKYSILVDASDRAGQAAATLRLVFWVEAEAFVWNDSLIYMAVTDRFKDGNPANNPTPTANVDPRADFHGGDLEGIKAKIDDGTLDQLGVRVLWVTPYNTNPPDAWIAADGVHLTMGYHGYWPIKPREVDPRIGGDQALHDMVTSAHAHGIRVLQDFVVKHVHQEHDYFKAHPEWFNTGCVCGTPGCDWTTHRIDCMFEPYLPSMNWQIPAVNQQWDDDATWWADTFDLDGFRVDAVKHVEDACIINLSARMQDEFDASGNHFFMTGETAMGWSDCGLGCNKPNYDLISHYIGPGMLDGQFDFVLYYAVPLPVFVFDAHGMIHADYWAQASGWEYPQGAIMGPYIGSQDTPRFVTLASYRGQDPAHDPSIPGNQWANIAGPPPDSEPYQRERLARAWLLGLPGSPLIYYGDEYGEWGGADPNNRVMWRGDGALSADEQTSLAWTRTLGTARRNLVALRRGAYRPVYATNDVLVYARQTDQGDVALVVLNHLPTPTSLIAALPITLPVQDGTVLHDRMGGPDVQVSAGTIAVTLGPRGAAVLAP
jgi:glycosidase